VRRVLLLLAALSVLLALACSSAVAENSSSAARKATTQAQRQGSPRANKPSASPPRLPATRANGRLVNEHCSRQTLEHNDRGKCVRAIQWLLRGRDPAWRCKYAIKKHQKGANSNCRYWRIRKGEPSGVYGRATVLAVQTAKRRLGYDVHRANGAAGPKLRAYLLGRPLPRSYVDRKEKRFWAWHGRSEGPGEKMKKLMGLAAQAIAWSDHYFYTQTSRRSDFLTGLGPPWPKGGDCSGSVAAMYRLAYGASVQTGSYSPWDWTGSMQDRGRVVWRAGESLTKLHLGDLVFYGYGGAPFTHVAMVISRDGGRVYTFGNDDCPCNASTLYRGDARIARRYVG
jgi:hypothetical protein